MCLVVEDKIKEIIKNIEGIKRPDIVEKLIMDGYNPNQEEENPLSFPKNKEELIQNIETQVSDFISNSFRYHSNVKDHFIWYSDFLSDAYLLIKYLEGLGEDKLFILL